MVTLTVALLFLPTVTVDALNETVAGLSVMNGESGRNVFGPVAIADWCDKVNVRVSLPVLLMVSVRVAGPASLSPSASLPGETSAVDSIAARMSSMPAPCRCVASNADVGDVERRRGDALF